MLMGIRLAALTFRANIRPPIESSGMLSPVFVHPAGCIIHIPMNLPFPIRILLAVVITLLLALLLMGVFYATNLAFDVWDKLMRAPVGFIILYLAILLAVSSLVAYAVWRLLRPRNNGTALVVPKPLTEGELTEKVEQYAAEGIDVETVKRELQALVERRKAGKVYVALFGDISTGKSSLIKALLPEADVAIDPRGGTTREVVRYTWKSPRGDQVFLTDMPGLHEADGDLDELSREEAQRAHFLIYVVDGDITRDQYDELKAVMALKKPIILALNKIDRFTPQELDQVRGRLYERIGEDTDLEVIAVSAGGQREAVKVHPDGREEKVLRAIPPNITALETLLQAYLERDAEELETLRDKAVINLANRKLDEVVIAHRHKRATEVVDQYTKKAMLGALAAISPGSDVIIQGYLGVALIKTLCDVFEVSVRDMNVTRFLELVSKNVGKTLPIVLAVSGNALKAFPGIGTVAGGLMHAVGYGLIFESLGRAVAASLEQRGEFAATPTLQMFEENLRDNLEERARRLAKLAFTQGRKTRQ
jgi:uncharacterized protein